MNTYIKLLAAGAIFAFTLTAPAAEQKEHSHDHPPAKKAGPGGATQAAKEKMAGMDRQMKDMMAMHEKMMGAKTPEERRALMDEHMKSMKGGMAMMEGGGAGMSGMGMMKGGGHAGMSHEMMEKRMDMMQQMMKMMMERMSGPAQ
ncbi:MAG: hypothetical protein JNM79_25300 [Burkholderiales bacterium]|nr:hypothetical protein [Burkholderiales bacterium]